MYTKETFSTQLKSLLKKTGFSQRFLADKLNTTEATVSRYVAGVRTPNIETAVALADIFGVSMDTLVGVIPKDGSRSYPDERILMTCYEKMDQADRRVLWSFLDRYMTPAERAVIDAIQKEAANESNAV